MTNLKYFVITLSVTLCYANKIQNLNGQWLLKDEAEEYKDLNATVPGGIYTDLMNNNVIGDVFYGYGDTETTWVPRTNWTYSRQFTVDEELLNYEHINIVFEGLDTFAGIVINDVVVGMSDSMFVRYIFDIKEIIQSGENTIEIHFLSPIEVSSSLAEKQNQDYVVPPECPNEVYRGECYVNQIRKVQASFSWDWGPSFPSVGIWKDVYIEAFDSSVIRYVLANIKESENEGNWLLEVTTYFHNSGQVTGKLDFTLNVENNKVIEDSSDVDQSPNEYNETLLIYAIEISKDDVKTWWPNGYGSQPLYDLKVSFSSGDEICEVSKRIGFRKIELIEEEIDSGLTFYFKINDTPFFAKGSNLIPVDILPEKSLNPETIKYLMYSAKHVNMNMLRVWGGGNYESDYLYDLADELGILMWQDCTFASAMYPSRPEYLQIVTEEIRHQVKRLSSHPSLVLWAGNNENEGNLASNYFGTADNFELYKADYIKLYIDTIKFETNRISEDLLFVGSSPTNGKKSEEEGYVAGNPGDNYYGDIHYYNYNDDGFDTNHLPIPRFCSEYGYQSLPDIDSWLTATNNISDLHPESEFMDHRQHHPGGLDQNNNLLGHQVNLPDKESENYYKAYIFYSQIVQAMSMKIETEHYLSFKGRYSEDGRGNTMGALYWQLNDVWVAPTWSGIDYTGKWKLLHYYAKNFFSPIIITGRLKEDNKLGIYVVSDFGNTNATAIVRILKWDSFDYADNGSLQFDVTTDETQSIEVSVINIPTALSEADCGEVYEEAINKCFFILLLESKSGDNTLLAPENSFLVGKLKDANLKEANLQISDINQNDEDGKIFDITITSDVITLFVTLDSHEIRGIFSQNGFILTKDTTTVKFEAENPTTISELKEVLTITHFYDSQYL